MTRADAALIVAGLLAARVLLVLSAPHGWCWWCHGKRVRERWFSSSKRKVRCFRCKGEGSHRRVGATTVHRFFQSVAGDRVRERRGRP